MIKQFSKLKTTLVHQPKTAKLFDLSSPIHLRTNSAPFVEVSQNTESLFVSLDVSGVEELSAIVKQNQLIIKGKHDPKVLDPFDRFFEFERTVWLPSNCNVTSGYGSLEKGVLHLNFEKIPDEIQVEVDFT